MMLLGLAVGLFVARAHESTGCHGHSTDPEYACIVELDSDLTLQWTVLDQGGDSALSARIDSSAPATGWAAIGFSSDGSMIGSDAVVCNSDEAPVKYNLGGKSSEEVLPMAAFFQTLSEASTETTDGLLGCAFVRSMREVGDVDAGMWLIYAHGTAASVSQHAFGDRGALQVDFDPVVEDPGPVVEVEETPTAGPTSAVAAETPTAVVELTPTARPTSAVVVESPTARPTSAVVVVTPTARPTSSPSSGPVIEFETPTARPMANLTDACTFDDPEYDCALALDSSLTLQWSILTEGDEASEGRRRLDGRRLDEGGRRLDGHEGGAISARLRLRGGGWAAIGFSADGLMSGADAIVCESSSQTPVKYHLGGQTVGEVKPMPEAQQTLRQAEIVEADGVLSCTFVKTLSEPGEIQVAASGVGWGFLLYARGDGSISQHRAADRGTLEIDFASGASSTKNRKLVNSKAIKAHGIALIAAWAFCSPLAAVVARSKSFFRSWIFVHVILQLATLALTAYGFAKAYLAIKKADDVDHFDGRHPKYGIAVCIAVLVQFAMGLARPHPKSDGGQKTGLRWAFEIAHRILGYGLITLAAITLLGGVKRAYEDFDHISHVAPWNTAIIVPLTFSAGAIVLITLSSSKAVEDTAKNPMEEEKPLDASGAAAI